MKKEERKVLVIGLDGATFDLIKPWVKEGHLPNIKRIMDNGTYGLLESTLPPMTSPAWPSMITGKNPANHGCFDFTKQVDKSTGDVGLVSSLSIRSKTLWTLLSDANKTIGVMNVPVTYPPQKVNGFIISGMLSPDNRGVSYPKELIGEISQKCRPYRVYPAVKFREGNEKAYLDDMFALLKERGEITLWLMRNKPWDFFFVVFSITDGAAHCFWKYMDKKHPQYMGDNNGFNDAILQSYKRVDKTVNKLIENAGRNAYIFLVSDHGAGPLHKSVNLNIYLKREGFIVMKKSFKTMLKMAMFRLGVTPHQVYKTIKRLHIEKIVARKTTEERDKILTTKFLSFDEVDWTRTKAFSRGYFGQIFINARGEELKLIKRQVKDALLEMRDPQTKEKIVTKVMEKENIYSGKCIDEAPDMILIMKDYKYISYPFFASNNSLVTPQIRNISGSHRQYGIFCVLGPDIKKGQEIHGLRIIDVCPTILHLFDIPVPEDIDGRVIHELYKEGSEMSLKDVRYQKSGEENRLEKIVKDLKISGKI